MVLFTVKMIIHAIFQHINRGDDMEKELKDRYEAPAIISEEDLNSRLLYAGCSSSARAGCTIVSPGGDMSN